MNILKESKKKYDMPFTTQTIFWDSFGSVSPKYRIIPVNKVTEAEEASRIPIENVFAVKDLQNVSNIFHTASKSVKEYETASVSDRCNTAAKALKELETANTLNISNTSNTAKKSMKEFDNISNLSRSSSFREAIKSTAYPTNFHGIPKQSPNADSLKPVIAIEPHGDTEHSFLNRLGQGSLSEPILAIAKDRGDTVAFKDVRRQKDKFQNICHENLSVHKSLTKERIVKGCLYIKNTGNIYKSVIEAKQVDDRDILRNNFPRFTPLFRNSTSKNMLWKKDSKFQAEDMGDLEIAIHLSGLVTGDVKRRKQEMTNFGRTQRTENKVQHDRVKKQKKSFVIVNTSNVPSGKSFQTASQVQTSPSKTQRIELNGTGRHSRCETRLKFDVKKSNDDLLFSSDDSGAEYELDESGAIVSKTGTEKVSFNNSSNVKNFMKPCDSRELSYRSRKTGSLSSRSKLASQATLYSDISGIHKPKVTPEEMWTTFEIIFKTYASTSRHSAEVISRRISTEWMINAGLVNEIMTQKEADDAFRSVAGNKITMNAQEYKDFLINLSLKMKLPYYEIYRRMCGM